MLNTATKLNGLLRPLGGHLKSIESLSWDKRGIWPFRRKVQEFHFLMPASESIFKIASTLENDGYTDYQIYFTRYNDEPELTVAVMV